MFLDKEKILIVLPFLMCFAFSFANPEKADVDSKTPHIRDYNFSFLKGNLLSNWSFEDEYYGWECVRLSKKEMEKDPEILVSPISGSYVSVADAENGVATERIPIEGGESYVLSFFVNNLKEQELVPYVKFYASAYNNASTARIYMESYKKESGWLLYEAAFTAPEDARFAKIVLASGCEGRVLFDDVVLEKGTVASDRNTIGKTISYSDGVGLVYMTQSKIRRGIEDSFNDDHIHAKAFHLLPSSDFNMYSIYSRDRLDFKSNSSVLGGDIAAGNIYFDNDVVIKDAETRNIFVAARESIYMKDRVSLFATVMYGGSIQKGNQDYIQQEISKYVEPIGSFDIEKEDVGSDDVFVENDKKRFLDAGSYGNLIAQSRSSLTLSAGRYIFKSFRMEPFAKIVFDLSHGNIIIYVDEGLNISNNVIFESDEDCDKFVRWEIAQKEDVSFGNDSRLLGIFIVPNAKVSLGDRSELFGALYAEQVSLGNNAKVRSPTETIFREFGKRALARVAYAPQEVQEQKSDLYLISATRYDEKSRIKRQYLPYVAELEEEGYLESNTMVNNYYSEDGDGKNAEGYAFFERAYSHKDGSLVKTAKPGKSWNMDSGHLDTAGIVYVKDLNVPIKLDFDNLDFSTKNNSTGAIYSLSFNKSAAGQLSLSWKNVFGQVVKEAQLVDSSDKDNLKWAITEYEYSKQGDLIKVRTPIDVDNGSSNFAIERTYDAARQLVSINSPDDGLTSFFYDLSGEVRMSISAEQRERKAFSYKDYDRQGRISSLGESVLSEDDYSDDFLRYSARFGEIPGDKREYIGYAYDKIDNCFDGVRLDVVKSAMEGIIFENTRGRLVCEWNRNPHAQEDNFTEEESIVVDFFSYDSLGRLQRVYRYMGLEKDPAKKIVSKQIIYDDMSRLKEFVFYDSDNNVIHNEKIVYDNDGRVTSIKDKSFNSIVDYSYDDLGKISNVVYGGTIQNTYDYHLHGAISALRVENLKKKEKLFEQKLNYEDVSGMSVPRYDGKISEIITRYSVLNNEEEKYSHFYDLRSNLKARLSASGELYYAYDKNGRLLEKIDNSNVYNYVYKDNSYQLTHVDRANVDGSSAPVENDGFDYDESGRITYDAKKQLSLKYDSFGKTILFNRNDGVDDWKILNFYGPQGENVGQFIERNGVFYSSKINVMVDGDKIVERIASQHGAEIDQKEYRMILAGDKILGRILPSGEKEWYVNDYQGSMVMSVQLDKVNNLFSYKPFGMQSRRIVSEDFLPSEQYTGKEFNQITGLYDFGARYFDPELGLWVSPDPARSYLNPYSFGGDPVNYIDPDGRSPEQVQDYVRDMINDMLYKNQMMFNEFMLKTAFPMMMELTVLGWLSSLTITVGGALIASGAVTAIASGALDMGMNVLRTIGPYIMNEIRLSASVLMQNMSILVNNVYGWGYRALVSGSASSWIAGYFGPIGMPGASDEAFLLSLLPSISVDNLDGLMKGSINFDFSEQGNLKANVLKALENGIQPIANDAADIAGQVKSLIDDVVKSNNNDNKVTIPDIEIPQYQYTPYSSEITNPMTNISSPTNTNLFPSSPFK